MLNKLEARFRLAGYKNIHFIIISHKSNSTELDSNSSNKIKFRKSYRTMNSDNMKNMASNVTVLHTDNSDSENDYFRDFNVGSAYVFDQCSRLAYIIYYPWSSIQRPYVKASILSTIYDAPCGECDIKDLQSLYPDLSVASSSKLLSVLSTQPQTFSSLSTDVVNETTTLQPNLADNVTETVSRPHEQIQVLNTTSSEETNSDDGAYVIPIKVILHAEHVHQDPSNNETFLKFNYILMRTNDTNYHGHFETYVNAERLVALKNKNETNIHSNDTNVDDEIEDFISPTTSLPLGVLVNKDGDQYDQINEQTIVNDEGDIVDRFNEILWKRPNEQEVNSPKSFSDNKENRDRAMSSESDQENDRHYSQILQWIHFNL